MSTAPTFADWLADRLGTRQWVVASRLTDRLRDRGYDVAVPQASYAAFEAQYDAMLTAAKVERIALALFPDDFHDGHDCRAEIDRVGQPCRICADNSQRWQDRIKSVLQALSAENLI